MCESKAAFLCLLLFTGKAYILIHLQSRCFTFDSLHRQSLASCLTSVAVSHLCIALSLSLLAKPQFLFFFRLRVSPLPSSLRLSHMLSILPISHSTSVINILPQSFYHGHVHGSAAQSRITMAGQWYKFSAVEYSYTYICSIHQKPQLPFNTLAWGLLKLALLSWCLELVRGLRKGIFCCLDKKSVKFTNR